MTPEEMKDRIAELEHELDGAKEQVRRAYGQRANLAVAFSKLASAQGWLVGRGIDSKEHNDMEWRHVLYIALPNGEQVSYHFAPDDLHMLNGLPTFRGEWDGKYTSTTEWHNMLAPVRYVDLMDLESYAISQLSGVPLRRWLIEKEQLEADKDVSERDRDRILRGYVRAWSR